VVWFEKGIVIFARFDACHNAWCEGSGIMRSHKYVTHWTTLDEAKAAPELVEACEATLTWSEHLAEWDERPGYEGPFRHDVTRLVSNALDKIGAQ
jgi:hypothetical protein